MLDLSKGIFILAIVPFPFPSITLPGSIPQILGSILDTDASSARKTNEWTQGDYVLTDDPARQDFERIHELMRLSYWANDRPREVMARGMRHSVCLGLLHRGALVGFARGVTDHATFTWVCDVMIHPDHRGRGLGKWMMRCCLEHPELQTTSQHLCTRDAHGLYEPFGFKRIEAMRRSSKPL